MTNAIDTPAVMPAVRRRDFINVAAISFAGVGVVATVIPLVNTMNPSADVLAIATTEVDLSPIALGQRVTVKWRGQPVFIVHRTAQEIADARAGDHISGLRDPATDAERVQRAEWLVLIGVCTHLGCIPLGQHQGENRGRYGGWFCPCHGSVYDTDGRIRHGPAPRNLDVPPYKFLTDTSIQIG